MLKIPAVVLPVPHIVYSGNKQAIVRDGKWNLAEQKFRRTGLNVKFKIFIIFVPETATGLRGAAAAVANGFVKALRTYAMTSHTVIGCRESPNFCMPGVAKADFEAALAKGANFVFLLLEKKSAIAYPIFKELADRTFGIQSQCSSKKTRGLKVSLEVPLEINNGVI